MRIADLFRIVVVGVGATVFLDVWLAVLRRLGAPSLPMHLIGRWVGHAARGQPFQPAIARAPVIRGEVALGWFTHYAIGVVFAGILFAVQGMTWSGGTSLTQAVVVGLCTVAAPLLLMQPAMGAGFAASKTATPAKNCLRSALNHSVFGLGLYLSAVIVGSVEEWAS